jgi:hypothetical protein
MALRRCAATPALRHMESGSDIQSSVASRQQRIHIPERAAQAWESVEELDHDKLRKYFHISSLHQTLKPEYGEAAGEAFAHASRRHCLNSYETKTQRSLFFSIIGNSRNAGSLPANAGDHARRLFRI